MKILFYMILYPHIIFVGQGPSQGQWKKLRRLAGVDFAERECQRLALLGRVGEKLSKMLGISVLEFAIAFRRQNLNTRSFGKKGKGHRFDDVQALGIANVLISDDSLIKYVLLGKLVANEFDLQKHNWLDVIERGDKSFFLLPHPSGINLWYNSKINKAHAAKKLKEFVYEA